MNLSKLLLCFVLFLSSETSFQNNKFCKEYANTGATDACVDFKHPSDHVSSDPPNCSGVQPGGFCKFSCKFGYYDDGGISIRGCESTTADCWTNVIVKDKTSKKKRTVLLF